MLGYTRHSTKRVKMKPVTCSRFSGEVNIVQYFLRSHAFVCGSSSSKSLFALSVIVFCVLQQAVPCNSSDGASSVKSANDRTLLNTKVSGGNVNHIHEITSSTKQGGRKVENHYDDDIDIVGYGEDCSAEGPFCDEARHLICDSIDETCVCNEKQGYLHINNVPGGMEQHLLLQNDQDGNPYVDLNNGNVCISKQEIIERTEQLLGLSKARMENVASQKESSRFSLDDYEYIDSMEDETPSDISENHPSFRNNMEMEDGTAEEKSSIYSKYNMEIANKLQQPDYDDQRLKRFQIREKVANSAMSEKQLIIKEILKYWKGTLSLDVLDELEMHLKDLLDLYFSWRTKKLSNSICSRIFDVDGDGIFTHEEYVIALMSENVRTFTIPKTFLDLIGPLVEVSCISMEDLRALDHSSETLRNDFNLMDTNGDRCLSRLEFGEYASETCEVNWLTMFLKESQLYTFLDILDPTAEEIFVRRVFQNEQLSVNWEMVDKDKDGFISLVELHNDLAPLDFPSESSQVETNKLMNHLDKNKDGRISLSEAKRQFSVPEVTEAHQLDWLESLYELYETYDDEVKEQLDNLNESYKKVTAAFANKNNQDVAANYLKEAEMDRIFTKEQLDILNEGYNKITTAFTDENNLDAATNLKEAEIDRIFTIFDRNSNGEIDEVEFKLLMELMKKYVLYELLSDMVDSMDLNSDRKLSIFEYQEFFINSSATFRIYFRNLLALEEQVEELESDENGAASGGDYDEEDEDYYSDDDAEEQEAAVSSTKLTKRAAASNETAMVYKLFLRLDSNFDGFITKEDFYKHSSSYITKKSDAELMEEFSQLDIDNDGMLTSKDSEDFLIPLDFNKFKEAADAFSEEVFASDLKIQFPLVDINMDGTIQKEEFIMNQAMIFPLDEDIEFLNWLEDYLSTIPSNVEEASGKAFAEFDTNCDRYISEAEFESKLDALRRKNKNLQRILTLENDTFLYFNSLDLNKDGKISQNEFQLLLLRSGKTLSSE